MNNLKPNARLRGWQRITQNSNTTTITTAAQWDWKRHALTVTLEAFVNWPVLMIFTAPLTNTKKVTLLFVWCFHISCRFS
ncbi:hypothetical protein C4M50_18765 [Vibrio cholerae]|nr:hypothetical protein [Vibrio cholerae]EGR5013320.1 hypothetical protein [Vibrio cholerae]